LKSAKHAEMVDQIHGGSKPPIRFRAGAASPTMMNGCLEGAIPLDDTSRVRVLIADDHASVMARLVSLLEKRFDVVGAVDNGSLLIDEAIRLRPDVIVTDISMPGLNGIEALARLRRAYPAARVILLTMHAEAELVAEALRSGASGFVLKFSAGEELATAIDAVTEGRIYVTPSLM
jgi:DNA-binding NarL/FixJ family response regulator